MSILETVDLRDAGAVEATLQLGAAACRDAACRRAGGGSIELVGVSPADPEMSRTLIASGDLHDHPLHLARLVSAAGMHDANDPQGAAHLTLHELIHGERLVNGLDYSFRVLARAAALKAAFPERCHVLLANHEIAQLTGSAVAKNGVRCNDVFDEALEAAFGDAAGRVREAVRAFLRALPLAVRFETDGDGGAAGAVLCAHSLPAPELMDRFDMGVLARPLTDDDFLPRRGPAHLLTWGRGHTPADVERLASAWNVGLFVLGHEHVEHGAAAIGDRALVLNSDHDRGVYARIDLSRPASAVDLAARAIRLSEG